MVTVREDAQRKSSPAAVGSPVQRRVSRHPIHAGEQLSEIETPTKPAGPFEWAPAPSRTQWGAGMVLANVEIDRDHTLSIYAEADQAMNVAAALRRALAA